MINDPGKVITRFPPSPTGPLHIGNVRTALFNFLFAEKNGGTFIVRVEDTDKARSKKEYEADMLESLAWLGIRHSGELWRQSERGETYKKYLDQLIENGKAYVSAETEGNNQEVVRFKNPKKIVAFDDLIRGEVKFETSELGDFIIAKNIYEPVYHLAVVIDDFESGVTHVIRGEDHISNTPRQILIQEAIGAPRPVYAHLPLILAPDRSKLSKRKHGESVSLNYYRKQGYLPSAILNYLALLGWNSGTDREIFSLAELIEAFDMSQIQKSGAVFDEKKLRWVNKEHLKRLPSQDVLKIISDKIKERFPENNIPENLPGIVAERIEIFSDVDALIRAGELDYFFKRPEPEKEKISWKNVEKGKTISHLQKISEIISSGGGKKKIMAYADREGLGDVLWPLRYVLSGREKSPDPIALFEALGKEESIKRIEAAVKILK